MEVKNQEGQGPLWAVVPLMMTTVTTRSKEVYKWVKISKEEKINADACYWQTMIP
jgi:hypothetical protein